MNWWKRFWNWFAGPEGWFIADDPNPECWCGRSHEAEGFDDLEAEQAKDYPA